MSTTVEMEWTPTKQAILGPDPELSLYAEISLWFHKMKLFRRDENQRMYLQNPAVEDLTIHKNLVLRLITDGEHLQQLAAQAGGLVRNREEIKLEDLAAAVETLRDTYRGWHESMPAGRSAEILKKVFPNVA